jgi:hypothetical protein
MRNLSNPVVETLSPALLDQEPSVRRIGYTVRLQDGSVVHLLPQYDSVGVGAALGEEVEVSSIGLGVHAQVIQCLEGYSSKTCTDTSLQTEEKKEK